MLGALVYVTVAARAPPRRMDVRRSAHTKRISLRSKAPVDRATLRRWLLSPQYTRIILSLMLVSLNSRAFGKAFLESVPSENNSASHNPAIASAAGIRLNFF